MKQFDEWNLVKQTVNGQVGKLYGKRDIWWCSLGVNVGFEQDGTGNSFERPVIVLRGFSRSVCLVVPLTTSLKQNKYHFAVGEIDGRQASAIISQVRLVDTRRFIDKIGMLETTKFEELKNAVRLLI